MGRPRKDQTQQLQEIEQSIAAPVEMMKALPNDLNARPEVKETDSLHKIAAKDIDKNNQNYLKPTRVIGSKERFNERFREDYNFDKEYVNFIAEHREIINEKIEIWTKPYPGCPAEFWEVPTGKAVWAPRYVAEQIKRSSYRQLKMTGDARPNNSTGSDGYAEYHGQLCVESTMQRLDARPVETKRSIFFSA